MSIPGSVGSGGRGHRGRRRGAHRGPLYHPRRLWNSGDDRQDESDFIYSGALTSDPLLQRKAKIDDNLLHMKLSH